MTACFLKNGNKFRVTSRDEMDLHDKLPAGNYLVKKDQFGNLFLEKMDEFESPTKIYGDHAKDARRILTTFKDRHHSTGVLFCGQKGSGKTMVAKLVSAYAAEEDSMPTIVVNEPYNGDAFNTLLNTIDQPCIVLFDEFEKVFDSDDQKMILTLLDGVFGSKKLFMLTCNNKWSVDSHMRNRPGRLFYLLEYQGVDTKFVREYCHDKLKDKSHIEEICDVSQMFYCFTFDLLQALVEEMNRYKESPTEALRMLNTKPDMDDDFTFVINDLRKDDVVVDRSTINEGDNWNGNPLKQSFQIRHYVRVKDSGRWESVNFDPDDLRSMDADKGVFSFTNKDGWTLLMTRKKEKSFSFGRYASRYAAL